MSAIKVGPQFDPYQWPVIDKDNSITVVMHMIYGMVVYEMCMCLETYLSICNKAKMKTAILRLMTVAMVSHITCTIIDIVDVNSLTRKDMIVGNKELAVITIRALLNVIGKISYYIAATLRSRALLSNRPKLLWSFYVLLVVCLANNIAVAGLYIHFLSILHGIPPEALFQNFPKIMRVVRILQNESCACAAFDTTFSYTLMATFLYTIYKNLHMDIRSVFMVMMKHGDVQKMFVVCAAMALSAGTVFKGLDGRLPIAAYSLSFITQDTMFLRVSYKTTSELINQATLGLSNFKDKIGSSPNPNSSTQKTKVNPSSASNPASAKNSLMV